MDSENETPPKTVEDLHTEVDKSDAVCENKSISEVDLSTEKLPSNVVNQQNDDEATESNNATEVSDEVSSPTKNNQSVILNIELNAEENAINIPPDPPEKVTENQPEDISTLENAITQPEVDSTDPMQVDNSDQTDKECTTQDLKSDSIIETVSKDLDAASDVQSRDLSKQEPMIDETEDSESRTNLNEDSSSRLNADDDSVSKVNVDDVLSNLSTEASKNSDTALNDEVEKEESEESNLAIDSSKPTEIQPCESETLMDVDTESNNTSETKNETDVVADSVSETKNKELSEATSEGNTSPMTLDDTLDRENASGKCSEERVNTEFVQISQDKQDDSQIENHSMDAEDPFGGDNLLTDNSEVMETEAISKSKANFEKLGSEANNLQDVVNATASETATDQEKNKSDLESSPKPDKEVISTPGQNTADSIRNDDIVNKCEKIVEKLTENDEPKSTDAGDKKDKSEEKEKTTSTMETEPIVLPGQDDELCIIPDSMKDIEVEKKKDDTRANQSEETKKSSGEKSQVDTENLELPVAILSDAKEIADKEDTSKETPVEEIPKVQNTVGNLQSITDVIDVEEDLEKNTEVEEVALTDSCKQCNEVKPCKIKVKVGAELFSVCSKACKSAFKSANNKAMDIPSDGVNSKREKRCASCLLIIENGDERSLSWETMEFCNEECLGKFQTKYGSYCRNCNGSVQAVSLGKYCVRFGYDVRQFCCSVCLEEFKKGLKVCTYCQKDISAGTEGFLAPVGDKGQFKDFCTQDCMEKYSKMSSTEPPIVEKKACSVCQEV